MKALHSVSGLIETGAGVALLGCPSTTALLLLGAPLETAVASTVARVAGAGLLALGVACWQARDDSYGCACRGLAAAMLIYNMATVMVLAYADIGLSLHGMLLWPAFVLHAAMGFWCIKCLRRKIMKGRLDNRWVS